MKKINYKLRLKLVAMFIGGTPVNEIVSQYDVSKSSINNWVQASGKSRKNSISSQELYNMKRKLKRLAQENQIFKLAECTLTSPLKERMNAINNLRGRFRSTLFVEC